MDRKWIWIAAAGALALVSPWAVMDGERAGVAIVEARELRPEIVARAKVDAAQGVSKVRALVDGRLLQVLVHEGDVVEAGKLVAVIDNPRLRADLEQAKADVRTAEAELATVREGMRPEEQAAHAAAARAMEEEVEGARREWHRKSKLFEQQLLSRSEFDDAVLWLRDAEARLDQARAQARLANAGGRRSEVEAAVERVRAARAAQRRAEAEFMHTRLVAPSAGTVVARRGNPGDIVFPDATQTPIIEIADLGALEIRLEIEQMDADKPEVGMPVRLLDTQDRDHLGECALLRLGQRLQPRTIGVEDARLRAVSQVRPAWCRIEPGGVVKPLLLDQRMEAVILLPAVSARSTVPREAVHIEAGQTFVDRPGLLWSFRTPVTLGVRDSRFVEVEGIDAGEEVQVQ